MKRIYFGWSLDISKIESENHLSTKEDIIIQKKLYIRQFGLLNQNPNLMVSNLISQRNSKLNNQEQPVEEQLAKL